VGKEYDPNSQESMVKMPLPVTMSAEEKAKKSNTVVESFRTGYMIKGRLLRSAHVVVYE
jgi:molecular chaperone GrpE (heat shock protein)